MTFTLNTSNKSKFITFIQLGLPNSLFSVRELDIFSRKNIGSIMGLRMYDAFEINGLIFGIEYTRLLQGKFFDISPTPNWYQNAKYDFSSFEGRRWAAHSGTDSDDLLVYSGIIGRKKNIIIGLNYERHGVTYKFPLK